MPRALKVWGMTNSRRNPHARDRQLIPAEMYERISGAFGAAI